MLKTKITLTHLYAPRFSIIFYQVVLKYVKTLEKYTW